MGDLGPILILILAAIWSMGSVVRAYRQARYYQIEEYMSLRYLRWLLRARSRWLPTRPLVAWLVMSALLFVLTEAPGSLMFGVIGGLGAIIAVWPPSEGEIKKRFRATARAKRLLVTAIGLLVLWSLASGTVSSRWLADGVLAELAFIAIGTAGLLGYLLAPVALTIANLLMIPVEGFFRRQFIAKARRVLAEVNPTVIGITGSYGKTSTKTYLAHLLNGRYRAYPTPKSYNTMMGVCIAINNDIAVDRSIDYFVCEMGAYIPGEIHRICDLTHPTISIVIEVGPQHLERFGSLENIAIAKYEIIKALPPDGVGIFNWDNPYVRAMYERGYPATRIAVSKATDLATAHGEAPHLVATDIQENLDGLHFTITDRRTGAAEAFGAPLYGEHTVMNLLLSAAVALHEGMTLREIARRVRTLQPAESRLVRQTTPEGITIINDAYSANPVGVVYALKTLALHQQGRRLLITPGMVELGAMMESENRKLGVAAAAAITDAVLVGSKQTEPIKTGLLEAGFDANHLHVVETLSEAVEWYRRNLKSGDTVLFMNDLPDTYSS